jgi:hypothetical protein
MASTYSTNLKIELIGTGTQAGLWGTTTNTNLGTALEQAIVGKADVAMSSTTVTLTLTNANTAQDARAIYLNLTGSPGGAAVLEVPAIEKPYIVKNGSDQQVTIKVSGQTGVPIPATKTALVYNNGTDVVTSIDHIPSLTLGAALAAASGGTGLTSPGSSGNVLTSNGTAWTSAALPAGGIEYEVKTANYTAADKEGILADTSGGAFTVTLPATPATGAQIIVADPTGDWGTNNLTIGRNGETISDVAEDLICDISGVSVQLVYDGSTWAVYAQVGGNGGTVVTEAGTQTLTNKTLGATTLSGTLSVADNLVNRPVLQDYAIEGSAIGNAGATRTFDLAVANFFSVTIDQATTFTFSNPPASGDFGAFVMEITNGAAFVITFPASVDFPGGTAPTLTASGVDQLVFTTRDGGTTYFGFVAGLDIKSP